MKNKDSYSIPEPTLNYLNQKVDSLDFNIFEFDSISKGDGLIYFLQYVFQINNLTEKFNLNEHIIHNLA